MTSVSVRPLYGPPVPDVKEAGAKTAVSPRTWMIVTCLLLGISGGIRYWRDWQFQAMTDAGSACPFPLKDLPKSLGSWYCKGSEAQLDPEVSRVAGSSDHIIWEYADEQSGASV